MDREIIKTIKNKIYGQRSNILIIVILSFLTYFSAICINFTGNFENKKIILKLGIVNICIWFIIFKFLQAIFNKYWISLSLTTLLCVVLTIANFFKIKLRDEPILPSDLKMINNFSDLLRMVNGPVIWGCIFFLVFVFVIAIYFEKNKSQVKLRPKNRIIWITIFFLFSVSTLFWNHDNTVLFKFNRVIGNDPIFWNQAQGARQNGGLLQFLNNIDVKVMEMPSDYSKQKMISITKKYKKLADKYNKNRINDISKQDIIFNLSESFADPNRVPGIKIKDPITKINSIKNNTTSGLMMSSGYGGGTANIEYMTLTGLATCNFYPTLTTPYTQLVPRQQFIHTFLNNFNYSVAIHPFTSEFYNRKADYEKFGFDRFYNTQSKKYPIKYKKYIGNNPYLSDYTAYKNLIYWLNCNENKGKFINLITIQNHMPYDSLYKKRLYKASVNDNTNRSEVENYAMGINYTDKVVAGVIKKIEKMRRPVTLVFYGDHLPGIYKNNMKKDGIALHQTDYFIYSNKMARKKGAVRLKRDNKYISPNDFIAMVLEQTNSKVTPYQAFLTKIWHNLPAFSTNSRGLSNKPQFINQHGKITRFSSFETKQKKLWHDYLLVQYDLTAGKCYLKNTDMFKNTDYSEK